MAANRHAVASGCDVFRDGPRAVAFLHLHSQQCGHDDQLSIPAGRGDRDDAVFPRKKFRLAAGCDPHLTGGCGAAFVGRYRRSAERPCHRRRRVRGSDRADLHDLYRRCEKKPYFPARSDDPGFLCPAFQRLLLPRVRSVHDRCSAARQVASLAKPPVTGPGADRRIQPDARSSNQGDRFYDDIDPRFDGAADGSTRRGAAFRGEVRPRQCLGPDTDYHGGHHRHSSGQEKGTSANPPARKHPLASAVTAAEETFRQGATDYRSFFSGRLGNHPFSTRLRCSNNSPILQNEEAPQTANRVDQTMFSTSTEPMTAAIPIRRKIHQIRTPK